MLWFEFSARRLHGTAENILRISVAWPENSTENFGDRRCTIYFRDVIPQIYAIFTTILSALLLYHDAPPSLSPAARAVRIATS